MLQLNQNGKLAFIYLFYGKFKNCEINCILRIHLPLCVIFFFLTLATFLIGKGISIFGNIQMYFNI